MIEVKSKCRGNTQPQSSVHNHVEQTARTSTDKRWTSICLPILLKYEEFKT